MYTFNTKALEYKASLNIKYIELICMGTSSYML